MGGDLIAKKRLTALLLIFALPAANVVAQAAYAPPGSDREHWPQWLRDARRWEIVAFGSFPFTMFFSGIGVNMYRWHRETGMDWSRRQYAPWPITSSGAVPMTGREVGMTVAIAAGLSVGIAIADHFIVRARRQRAARRAEAIPAGAVIITRTPLIEEPPWEEAEPDADAGSAEAAVPGLPP